MRLPDIVHPQIKTLSTEKPVLLIEGPAGIGKTYTSQRIIKKLRPEASIIIDMQALGGDHEQIKAQVESSVRDQLPRGATDSFQESHAPRLTEWLSEPRRVILVVDGLKVYQDEATWAFIESQVVAPLVGVPNYDTNLRVILTHRSTGNPKSEDDILRFRQSGVRRGVEVLRLQPLSQEEVVQGLLQVPTLTKPKAHRLFKLSQGDPVSLIHGLRYPGLSEPNLARSIYGELLSRIGLSPELLPGVLELALVPEFDAGFATSFLRISFNDYIQVQRVFTEHGLVSQETPGHFVISPHIRRVLLTCRRVFDKQGAENILRVALEKYKAKISWQNVVTRELIGDTDQPRLFLSPVVRAIEVERELDPTLQIQELIDKYVYLIAGNNDTYSAIAHAQLSKCFSQEIKQ